MLSIITTQLEIKTKGQGDFVNLTPRLSQIISDKGMIEGFVNVFVVGSTAGILTLEFEPGLIKDLNELYETLCPKNKDYHHHQTWGDYNGSSHLRASLQGPFLCVPFKDSKLCLGTWQQVALAEFDTTARVRKIIVQIIGK